MSLDRACGGWTRTWPAPRRTAVTDVGGRRKERPVGEEGWSVVADAIGEEERRVAVSTPVRYHTSGCHCRWERRGECHGLHAHALPHLPLPLPMLEKKGGAPLPMSLGKKRGASRSPRPCAAAPPTAADGEEEGSAVAASWLIDGTGGALSCLPLLHPCPGATESGRARGVEREIFFGSSGRGRAGGAKIRTGGRCEDKDGRTGGDIFGWRRTGSEIFLVVGTGISN
jgi:hypothetical protein